MYRGFTKYAIYIGSSWKPKVQELCEVPDVQKLYEPSYAQGLCKAPTYSRFTKALMYGGIMKPLGHYKWPVYRGFVKPHMWWGFAKFPIYRGFMKSLYTVTLCGALCTGALWSPMYTCDLQSSLCTAAFQSPRGFQKPSMHQFACYIQFSSKPWYVAQCPARNICSELIPAISWMGVGKDEFYF